MNIDIEALSDRMVAALFDGGYQGLLVVALIWAALKLSPRANAATRYAAWMVTLLVAAALPLVQFFAPRGESKLAISAPPLETISEETEEDFEATSIPTDTEIAAIQEPDAAPLPPLPTETPARTWHLSIPKYASAVLLSAWAVLALVRIVGLAYQLILLRTFRKQGELPRAELAAQFLILARRMKLDRPTSLLVSAKLDVPMAAGFLRPAILLPKSFVDSATERQSEQVLRHELAHVARRDDWGNLVQQIISAVFFFHPGIWVASRRLTVEREIACDDHALAAIGAPRDYALFLTEFAGRARGRVWTAAPAAWSSKSQLKERIVMILDGKRNASPRLARARALGMAMAAVTLAATAMIAAPRLVLAGDSDEITEAKEKPPIKITTPAPAADPKPAIVAVTTTTPNPVVKVSAPTVTIATPSIKDLPKTPKPPRAVVALTDPPEPVEPRRRSQDSIERRLEALERMVEKLSNRERADKAPKSGWSEEDEHKIKKLSEEHAKMAEKMAKVQVKDEEWNRMRDELKRETDRARRDIERAARDAERASQQAARASADNARMQSQSRAENFGQGNDSLKARRQALQAQRRSIEKQIEALEREIQEQDREKSERSERSEKPEPKEKSKDKDNSDAIKK